MKADTTKIFNLLNGDKHYVVPIYQRLYSWGLEECKKLFNDVISLMGGGKKHFTGTIVEIIHSEKNSGTLVSHVLIDGQQRFTTFTLFILALMDHFDNENWEEMKNTYLVNQYKSGDEHYKLLLIEKDMSILKKLVNKGKLDDEEKESLIFINFNFLKQEIAKSKYSFAEFRKSLDKLMVVIIDLDIADNPQLIFESINSTGLSLTQGDLIKNYILMDLNCEDQKNIYQTYWKEIEDELIRFNQLDNFFKHFLSIKNLKIPNINDIYEEFKKYHKSLDDKKIIDFVKDIYSYFEIFHLILKNSFQDEKIKKSMSKLILLKIDVINPLLMELFNRYNNNLIDSKDVCFLIDTFTSYIVRRQFCGLPTASLNKAFISLINSLKDENIKESILVSLLKFNNTQIFPKNSDFKANFIHKDIYNMKSKNAILKIIEDHSNKEELKSSNYTVEHILPQGDNLPEVWKKALGDDWKKKFDTWVQTIGNITLTRYNSEYSNHSFEKKKTMEGGLLESQLKLNKFVVKCDEWNDVKIKERAVDLFNYCLTIWERPELDQSILDKYVEKSKKDIIYHLKDFKYYADGSMNKIYDRIINFARNINSNIDIKVMKVYVNIKENENTLASLVIDKKSIKMYFFMKKKYVDEHQILRSMDGIGHKGTGDTEISIDGNNFGKCSKIIEQFLDIDN